MLLQQGAIVVGVAPVSVGEQIRVSLSESQGNRKDATV
jgi:hypothetical protein